MFFKSPSVLFIFIICFFKKATPKQKMFIKQGDVEKQLKRIFFDVNESNPEKLL